MAKVLTRSVRSLAVIIAPLIPESAGGTRLARMERGVLRCNSVSRSKLNPKSHKATFLGTDVFQTHHLNGKARRRDIHSMRLMVEKLQPNRFDQAGKLRLFNTKSSRITH